MGSDAERLIESGFDDGDFYQEMREEKRIKKRKNYEYAKKLFLEKGVEYIEKPNYHFILKEFHFWPSTGLYINQKTKKKGRGVHNLVKIILKKG